MTKIHETAIVDPTAKIGHDVEIGPWAYVGANVTLGDGCRLESHSVVKGPSTLGKNCHVFQFATIGEATPDLKYQGEDTTLTVGDNNVFREGVTVHRGTVQDRSDTFIGNNNLLMAYVHVGHDCVIGNHCVLVNNTVLAGHVKLDDWVITGGYSGVHQHCRLGAHAFIGGMSKVTQDVPAFVIGEGHPASPRMINIEGLKRRDFSEQDIKQLQKAFKTLYRKKLSLEDAKTELALLAQESERIWRSARCRPDS